MGTDGEFRRITFILYSVAYPRGGGLEGPRTLPWLQAGSCFSASGAPLLVTSVSVSGYYFLLVDVFGLSVALICSHFIGAHITYCVLISMWGSQSVMWGSQSVCGALIRYDMAPSRYLVPQMSIWTRTVNVWGPQYDMALVACGALGV